MGGTVMVVADRSEAVMSPGEPSAQMGAWTIPVPDGSSPLATAGSWADSQSFPSGTQAWVIDMDAAIAGTAVGRFALQSNWVQI